jgi:hypothetical protein
MSRYIHAPIHFHSVVLSLVILVPEYGDCTTEMAEISNTDMRDKANM